MDKKFLLNKKSFLSFVTCLSLFCPNLLLAQNTRSQAASSTCEVFTDDVWYFGTGSTGKSPGIVFNDDGSGGKVAADASNISKVASGENSLSVSSPGCNGSLIFYSQYNQLFNAKHELMKNGSFTGHTSVADGLAACYIGDNKYILFAVNNAYEGAGGIVGLDWHIVDMNGDGGFGEKTSSANIVSSGMSESIELIPIPNTSDEYWLVYRMNSNNTLVTRRVTKNGVSGVVNTFTLPSLTGATYFLKANKDYNMLALVYPSAGTICVMNFNQATGIPILNRNITPPALGGTLYGMEISANSRFIYASAYNNTTPMLSQYDMQAGTWTTPFVYGGLGGGMKLGPDGKLYVMKRTTNSLGVIANPEIPLTQAGYNPTGFPLSVTISAGLTLSTGLTPPAVCPSGMNTAPVCEPDYADVWRFPSTTINPVENDHDAENNLLLLSEAHFLKDTDSEKATLNVDVNASTITLTIKPGYQFTDGEKIQVAYTIRDNGVPIALCADGIATFTLRKAESCDLFSDHVWYFGEQMGIRFDKSGSGEHDYTAIGVPNTSSVASAENTLTITGSGTCGNSVIFYSQHNQIFMNNGQPMPGGAFSGHSSVNDGQAASYMGNNKYFFFAVSNVGFSGGLYYYQVDMNLNNGFGEVIETPTANEIEVPGTVSESIELLAVEGTTNEYWLIYNTANSVKIRKVTPAGVSAVLQTYDLGTTYTSGYSSLRSNKEGNLLSISYPQGFIYILLFDAKNGTINKIVKNTAFANLYNTCFSPSGQYLYAAAWTGDNKLYQYSLNPATLELTLNGNVQHRTTPNGGGMKLGPDNKLYVNNGMGTQYAGVLSTPDVKITDSSFSYVINGLDLGKITNNPLDAGHGMITFSTGITPPAVCPTGSNRPPVAIDDDVFVCVGDEVYVSVMDNDSDPDPSDIIRLVDVRLANEADIDRVTISYNPDDATVYFTTKPGKAFTSGEIIKVIYTIRDNGTDPMPQCAEGILAVTVSAAQEAKLKSQQYIACPDADVKLEVIPVTSYTYDWYTEEIGGTLLQRNSTSYLLTKDSSPLQTLWVEAIDGVGLTCRRKRVDIHLSSNCGEVNPTGCAATGSIIWKDDFGGNSPQDPQRAPGDASNHPLMGQTTYKYVTRTNYWLPAPNEYAVLKTADNSPSEQKWAHVGIDDHTSNTDKTRGYFLSFDADASAGQFYEFEIDNLCSNASLTFSAWLMNINPPSYIAQATAYLYPTVSFIIEDLSGNVLTTFSTGAVPATENPTWLNYACNFVVPEGVSSLKVRLMNDQQQGGTTGNDLNIDDIEVRFCAPPVTVTGLQDLYCTKDTMEFAGSYVDDGTFGDGNYEMRWIYSATGDMTSFDSWSEIKKGANLEIEVKEGYYRAIVGPTENLNSKKYNCCAISEVLFVDVQEEPLGVYAPQVAFRNLTTEISGTTTTLKIDLHNTGNPTIAAGSPVTVYLGDINAPVSKLTVNLSADLASGNKVTLDFPVNTEDLTGKITFRFLDNGSQFPINGFKDCYGRMVFVTGIYSEGFDDYYGLAIHGGEAAGDLDILANDLIHSPEEIQMNEIYSMTSTAGSYLTVMRVGDKDVLQYRSPYGFTGLDTIYYESRGLNSANTYEVVKAKVYVYAISNAKRSCYISSNSYPIRINDTDNNVIVDWYYAAGDPHGQPVGSIANSVRATIQNGVETYNLEAEVKFEVSKQPIGAFNNKVPVDLDLHVVPSLMYWSRNTVSNNWNDPANWEDASGNPLNNVPYTCTDVHIRGGANYYPSLDDYHTPRSVEYGEPSCNKIYYHHGSEVAKPHYLNYNQAYVHYNFGYYDNQYNFKTDGDIHSGPVMNRGQWYALAAPLKKIVSGDFSVGGYPNMWQREFVRSASQAGNFEGEWYSPDSTNIIQMANHHHAISIWAGEYISGTMGEGAGYHASLNALKGILEMPFFNNSVVSSLHRIHSYTGNASKFSYYDINTPGYPIIPENVVAPDVIERGSEAYRFIFDENLQEEMIDGYMTPVFKVTVPAGKEIMIGNPFVSTLDFNRFYEINQSKIDAYYRMYIDNGWKEYSYYSGSADLDGYIPPLQAFFVSTLGIPNARSQAEETIDLFFPLDIVSVTKEAWIPTLRSDEAKTDYSYGVLYINAENEEGNSSAILAMNEENGENVVKLFSKDYPKLAQIYILDKNNNKNSIQYEDVNEKEIALGISSESNELITLNFYNIENLYASSVELVDKVNNTTTNLMVNPVYKFKNDVRTQTDRFVLRIGNIDLPTGIEDNSKDGVNVNIYNVNKTLYVKANEVISDINVSNVQGLTVHSVSSVNDRSYTENLYVSGGVYIVTVKTVNGQTTTSKIIIK